MALRLGLHNTRKCADLVVAKKLSLMYLMFVARDLLKIFRWSEITGSRVRDPMAVID
jgi:hypothetical protein